jgi:hypothetical protein
VGYAHRRLQSRDPGRFRTRYHLTPDPGWWAPPGLAVGAVGTFLGLVRMLVQLVSAGGAFPWQTLPNPLSALHHVLPMGYAVDGVRRLMYGGSIAPVGGDLAVLMAYPMIALAVSTFAARRARVWAPARVNPGLCCGRVRAIRHWLIRHPQ